MVALMASRAAVMAATETGQGNEWGEGQLEPERGGKENFLV